MLARLYDPHDRANLYGRKARAVNSRSRGGVARMGQWGLSALPRLGQEQSDPGTKKCQIGIDSPCQPRRWINSCEGKKPVQPRHSTTPSDYSPGRANPERQVVGGAGATLPLEKAWRIWRRGKLWGKEGSWVVVASISFLRAQDGKSSIRRISTRGHKRRSDIVIRCIMSR